MSLLMKKLSEVTEVVRRFEKGAAQHSEVHKALAAFAEQADEHLTDLHATVSTQQKTINVLTDKVEDMEKALVSALTDLKKMVSPPKGKGNKPGAAKTAAADEDDEDETE